MTFPRDLRTLCRPSLVYFVIATLGLVLVAIQNVAGDPNTLVIGSMSMYVPSVVLVLIIKFIYIVFWTWVLDLICKDGYSAVSWLIILLPIILSFAGMLMVIGS